MSIVAVDFAELLTVATESDNSSDAQTEAQGQTDQNY